MSNFKKTLSPFASLRVTVVLLAAGMLLIFAGTLAQRETGIWQIQHQYFHSFWCWIDLKNILPFVQNPPNFRFPFIGGYTLIAVMLVNLLAAHSVRFKLAWKRSGVILTHLGLILLLVGEIATSQFAVESQMPIDQGATAHWSHDIRETELAIADTSPSDHDNVVVISENLLQRPSAAIQDKRLPFDVSVVRYFPNAVVPALLGPVQKSMMIAPNEHGEALSTAGVLKGEEILQRPRITGTEEQAADQASAFVKFSKDGSDLGTYLFSVLIDRPQKVQVGDKTYDVTLRYKRLYRPYAVTLLKFSHDKYIGSEMARNFSSRIRLVDPTANVDREILIRMNEPLRYGGETFYQSSFNQDRFGNATGTILQVVKNPGWWAPYVAVVVGAVGLVVHFGISLFTFLVRWHEWDERRWFWTWVLIFLLISPIIAFPLYLIANRARRRLQQSSGAPGVMRPVRGGKNGRGKNADKDSYTLQPTAGWASWTTLVPASFAALFLVVIFALALPHTYNGSTGLNLDGLARLPVSFDGRVVPVDTVARGSLKVISGHESLKLENGDNVPAIQWFADVIANDARARDYKAIRIDHSQVKALLSLNPDEKLFSISEVMGGDNSRKLEEQYDRLPSNSKNWDPFQKKLAELHEHLEVYVRFGLTSDLAALWDALSDSAGTDEVIKLAQAADATPPEQWSPEQRAAVESARALNQASGRVRWLADPAQPQNKKFDLYFGAPTQAGDEWQGLALAIPARAKNEKVNPTIDMWFKMAQALHSDRPADFNARVADYERAVALHPPTAAIGFETFFNRFDPFTIAWIMYISVFVFAAASWLGWRRPLGRTAVTLGLMALVLHTFGILSRMYIMGRPPVTNLYSSALFIGWGAVVLGLVLEFLFRNGIGSAVVGIMGFATLLVAGGLYVRDTDTMAPLQAVLDTNYWLATHVVIITLGYASTFLAGLLAIVYVVGRPGLSAEDRKIMARMVYGILCFATLFSFVGTILGGIWADQSWGRFWGWDPKENGAILIVLWNAIILHARWCGLARERGVMLLAIFGNIVTAWSWFGTNMLGVGLHSYGFMEHALFWLVVFVISQVGLIVFGSFFGSTPAAAKPGGRFPVTTKARPTTEVPMAKRHAGV